MEQFIDVATSFPAVVFTALLTVTFAYWCLSGLLSLLDVDLDADLELDGGVLALLDLHLIPLSLALTVIALVGWLTAMVASLALQVDGPAGIAVDTVVLVVAATLGVVASAQVARMVAPVFSPPPSVGHRDLIGRLCTIRTGRVDAHFGQAEVADGEGGLHLVQVRCPEPNELAAGHRALVVDLDGGVFVVSPDIDVIS